MGRLGSGSAGILFDRLRRGNVPLTCVNASRGPVRNLARSFSTQENPMQVAHPHAHVSLRTIAVLLAGVLAAVLLVTSVTAFVAPQAEETNRPFGT
jgi:hypothetical protein